MLIMLLALEPHQYDKNYIMFSDKTKNNILIHGDFYRIYYSPPSFCLNGIHLIFNLQDVYIESYFNKIKCTFDKDKNSKIILFIKQVEWDIMTMAPCGSNKAVTRIDEQLSQGFIKIFSDETYNKSYISDIRILLKISGVWTDDGTYGITFRFFFNRQL